jgi:hypothetical protein
MQSKSIAYYSFLCLGVCVLRRLCLSATKKKNGHCARYSAESRMSCSVPRRRRHFMATALFFPFIYSRDLSRSLISSTHTLVLLFFFFSHALTQIHTHPYSPKVRMMERRHMVRRSHNFELHARAWAKPYLVLARTCHTYCPFWALVRKRQSCSVGTDN